MSRTRWSYLALLATCVCVATLASACGPAAPTGETAKTVTANELVGEAMIGSAMRIPGEVVATPEVAGFVPPDTLECWRIVPGGELTEQTIDAKATRLGVGQPRTIGVSEDGLTGGVSAPPWALTFWRGDPECFRLDYIRYDEGIVERFEAGEYIPTITADQARQAADEYLASVGYAEELVFQAVGVQDSLTWSQLGKPSRTAVVSMVVSYGGQLDGRALLGKANAYVAVACDGRIVEFAHLLQHAEPAESVKLRPVAEALEDLRAGLGQCPVKATREGLSRLTVEGIEIAYYGPPTPIDEKYYKPVYVFHVRMADGTTGDWLLSAFNAGR